MVFASFQRFTTEQKTATGLVALFAAYGFLNAQNIKQRRRRIIQEAMEKVATDKETAGQLADNQSAEAHTEAVKGDEFVQTVPSASDRIVDHPVVAWVLENFSPWMMGFVFDHFRQRLGKGQTFFGIWWRQLLIPLAAEETLMAVNWFLTYKVYSHIPFFSKKQKKQTFREVMVDFLQCNLMMISFVAFLDAKLFTPAMEASRARFLERYPANRFRPLVFLFKVLFVRFFVDFFFWLGHYLMHKYNYRIHKKHHEHNKTKLTTNYHFTAADIFIEAFVPYFASMALLSKLHPMFSFTDYFEGRVLFSYVINVEILSHSGKPLPLMSTCAPFSLFTKTWDDWNPWLHELHHNLSRCNYSLTSFWDWVFGTDRYEMQKRD